MLPGGGKLQPERTAMRLLSSPEWLNSLSTATALQLHALIPVTKNTTSFSARQRNRCQELLRTRRSTLLSLTWKMSAALLCWGWQGVTAVVITTICMTGRSICINMCEPLSSSENIFIAPITAISEERELRTFSRHSSLPFIFTHFQSHYRFLLVTLLAEKCSQVW